jgi:FtsP/CotA-like multicopper oxidase with cupredoxin domain
MSFISHFINSVPLYLPNLLDTTINNGNDEHYVDIHYTKIKFAQDTEYSGLYDVDGKVITDTNEVGTILNQNIIDLNNNVTTISKTPIVATSYYSKSMNDERIYNSGNNIYGLPFFRIKRGLPFNINFTNTTGFSYNLHWHGINNNAQNDGASEIVEFGNETNNGPNYTINQRYITNNSAMTWVHAHPMFVSSKLVSTGIFGLVDIIDDESAFINEQFVYSDNYLILYYGDIEFNSNGTLDVRNDNVDQWRGNYGMINGKSCVCWYADINQQPESILHIQTMNSLDGTNWTPGVIIDSLANLTGIAYGGCCNCNPCCCSPHCLCQLYVATSLTGMIYYSPNGKIWHEGFGINKNGQWSGITNGITLNTKGETTYGFVAISQNGFISFSPDGMTWDTSIIPYGYQHINWCGVTNGLNIYVVVGFYAQALYSYNGVNWNIGSGLDETIEWCGCQYGVVNENPIFTAVSQNGNVAYSYDGIMWRAGNAPYDLWCGITYGNNKFVSTSTNGTVIYSTDGINWIFGNIVSTINQSNIQPWSSVVFGMNQFVAVGINGTAMNSTDGINWTITLNQPTPFKWSAIAYNNGEFISVSQTTPQPITNISPLPPPYVETLEHKTTQNLVKISLANVTNSFRFVYIGVEDKVKGIQNFYLVETGQGYRNPCLTNIVRVVQGDRRSILLDLNTFTDNEAYLFFYNFDLSQVQNNINLDSNGNLISNENRPYIVNNTVNPTPISDSLTNPLNYDEPSAINFPQIAYNLDLRYSYTDLSNFILVPGGQIPMPNLASTSKKYFLKIYQEKKSNIVSLNNQLSTVVTNIRKLVFGNSYNLIRKFPNYLLDLPSFEYNASFNYINYLNKNYFYNIPETENVPVRKIAFNFFWYANASPIYFDTQNQNKTNPYGSTDFNNYVVRIIVDMWNSFELNQTEAIKKYKLNPNNYKPDVLPSCLFKIAPKNDKNINSNMLSNDTLYIDIFDMNKPIGDRNSPYNNYPYYSDASNEGTTAFSYNPVFSTNIVFPENEIPLNIQQWTDLVNLMYSQTFVTLDGKTEPLSNYLKYDWSYFPFEMNYTTTFSGKYFQPPIYINNVLIINKNLSNRYLFRMTGKWQLLNFFGKSIGGMYMNPPGVMPYVNDKMQSLTGPMIMNYTCDARASNIVNNNCNSNMDMNTNMDMNMSMNMNSICCGIENMPNFPRNITSLVQEVYTTYADPLNPYNVNSQNPGPSLMVNMTDIGTFAIPPINFNDPILNINYSDLPGDNNGTFKGFVDGYQNDNFMNFSVKVNSSEKNIYYNMDTLDSHPYHFHLTSGFCNLNDSTNSTFNVKTNPIDYAYSSDIYAIGSQTQISFYRKFVNYSSNYGEKYKNLGFMYHCHFMPHHDMLMMGQYYVYQNRSDFF